MYKGKPAVPTTLLTRESIEPENNYQAHSDQALLFTVKQAAALLNLSVATLYRLIQTNQIPSLLIRGSRRLSREALQQWLREQQSC